ncbi:MAG: alpha/beta fold hydrolase [Anaerolineales bacterium]|nr:alpha/beta fold hydrolase [Anaerolineales bacterium]
MNTASGSRWVKSIFVFAAKVTITLTILTIVMSLLEVDHILHPPRTVPQGKTLRKYKIDYRPVDLTTADGVRLSAWYTPPGNGAVILLAHGYGNKRPEWVYALLARKKYGVLAWDARAHGESDGDISTIGYLEVLDVKAALDYVLAQPGVEHVGAWGGSMGGATIIRAAARLPQIEALFIDSSFTSLEDEFNYLVPYPVINPLAKFIVTSRTGLRLEHVNPLNDISKISPRPVYIVQGMGDSVAPPDSGEKLFHAAGEPRYLWKQENVPHLSGYLDNPRRYQRRLVDFFDEWLLGK